MEMTKKRKTKENLTFTQVDRRKIDGSNDREKHKMSKVTGILFWGGGLFGLLPNSILQDIGDSLPRVTDRFI